MSSYFSIRTDNTGGQAEIRLSGSWTVETLSAITEKFSRENLTAFKKITFDGRELEKLDTSAAFYLDGAIRSLKAETAGFKDHTRKILERIARLPHEKDTPVRKTAGIEALFIATGQRAVDIWKDSLRGVTFFGRFIANIPALFASLKNLRPRSIAFHVNEVGLKAVPIIALMSFSLSFVMAYQGAVQLKKFAATVYTIDLVVLSTLRELGVLITAIMLAGRSGSAFAAQLGTMKLNEEVDALQTMGVDPFQVLVMPRLIAILIALPLLTVIADMLGLMGGYAYMSGFLDYSWLQYASRLQMAAEMKHFYVGLIKAPVFAILIGIVGSMQGLRMSRSAEEVGRKTITAVVQAIFLVVLADAIFSIVFTKLGI